VLYFGTSIAVFVMHSQIVFQLNATEQSLVYLFRHIIIERQRFLGNLVLQILIVGTKQNDPFRILEIF
jgi:hypothetical protein